MVQSLKPDPLSQQGSTLFLPLLSIAYCPKYASTFVSNQYAPFPN